MQLDIQPSVYQEFISDSTLDDQREELNAVLENVISLFENKISIPEPSIIDSFLPMHAAEIEVVAPSIGITDLITSKIEREQLEEAFFVIDLNHVENQLKQWKSLLPRVKPYYAVKCNPDPIIVEMLASLGVNFDCASIGEIDQVLSYGVDSSRIIYANPCKPNKQIRLANERNVNLTTFDNSDELLKIKQNNPDAKVVLRIITDDSNSRCKFSTKFGAQMKLVTPLLMLAQSLDIQVVGVSFHVGSGCASPKSFSDAVISAKKVFEIAESLGIQMNLLDVGGGFPGVDEEDGVIFSDIANELKTTLDLYFPESSGINLIAEPGRYFVAGAHTLAVSVFARRNNLNQKEIQTVNEPEFLYYINDGVYGSFNCILYDHATVNPKLLHNPLSSSLHKCTIYGPTCDSMDCVAKDILLPQLEVGDWLFFQHMGAYTCAAATEFNGFKKPFLWYIYSGASKS